MRRRGDASGGLQLQGSIPSACPETAGEPAGTCSPETEAGRPEDTGDRNTSSVHTGAALTRLCGGTEAAAHQRLGVAEDVVLEELVQHVEQAVLHQRLYHQLVQVMLKEPQS